MSSYTLQTNKQTIYMYQLDPSELDPSELFAYSVNGKEILGRNKTVLTSFNLTWKEKKKDY